MNREYKEFEVNGNKVKMKAWLTAGERREIRQSLFASLDVGSSEGVDELKAKIKPELLAAIGDKQLEVAIVELNGDSNEIVSRLLQLKEQDFDEIVKVVNQTLGSDSDSEESKKK